MAFGDGSADARLLSAWSIFCNKLRSSALLAFKDHNSASPIQRVDAMRFLTQALSQAFDLALETQDPGFPQLHRFCGPGRKLGSDCADFAYHQAWIDGSSNYRLSGKRGNSRFFNITVQGHRPATFVGRSDLRNLHEPFGDTPQANLFGHDLVVESDGSFEVFIGGERRGANWLPTAPDTRKLFIRQGFDAWDEEPARLGIENLAIGGPPRPPSLRRMIDAIEWAGDFIEGCMTDWPDLQMETGQVMEPGLINAFPGIASGDPGDARRGRAAALMLWELPADHALVVEFEDYPGFWTFTNMGVFCNSMDYAFRPVSYTPARTPRDSDGMIRLIMAHADPGYWNWLDTQGFERGILAFRSIMSPTCPPVATRLVKLGDLTNSLPHSPFATPQDRLSELRRRSAAIRRRFAV